MFTLWKNDQIVGETTSGAWGYRTNSSIALGMIRSDLASAGTEIEIEIFETVIKLLSNRRGQSGIQ